MPEYHGTLQSFQLAFTLWLIPALPLAAALALVVGRALPRDDPRRARLADDRLAVAGIAAALVLGLVNTVQLLLPPARGFLFDPVATLIHSGSLDVGLAFAFDPLAAVCSLTIALAGVAVAWRARRVASEAATLPALALAVGAAELLVLADNLVLMLVGWHVAGIAAWLLIGSRAPGGGRAARLAFGVARLGEVAIVCGAALLFWGLGGSWPHGAYTPDYRPRLVAVEGAPAAEAAPETEDKTLTGGLTVAALPGATVYAGDAVVCRLDSDGRPGGLGFSARPCQENARTPFWRLPIAPARHDLRVDAGPGENQLLVEKLRVSAGGNTAVAIAGSTLVFREMADQLRIKDADGTAPLAGRLAEKRLWGVGLLQLACALMLGGALTRAASLPFGSWLDGVARAPVGGAALIAGVTGTLGGVYLLARLSFYLAMVPGIAGTLALFGAVTALVAGVRALAAGDLRALLVRVAAGQTGLAVVGVAAGAVSAGILELAVSVLAVTAWFLVLGVLGDTELGGASRGALKRRAPRLARAVHLGTLAVAGVPWPLVGTFWSRDGALWKAFGGASTGFVPGAAIYAVALLGGAAIAFAVWRACWLVVDGKPKRGAAKLEDASPPLALWLAGAALGLGLLGTTDAVVGGTSLVAPLASFFGEVATGDSDRLGAGMRMVVTAISFGLPLVAWTLARRRYAADVKQPADLPLPAWASAESRVAPAIAAALVRGADSTGQALVALDAGLDLVLGAPARLLAGREPEPAPRSDTEGEAEPANRRAEPENPEGKASRGKSGD